MRLDGLDWDIKYVPEGHDKLAAADGNDDEHLMGACIEWERTIYVCDSLDERTKADCVAHEVVHALVRTSSGIPGGEPIQDDSEAAEEALVKFCTRAFWVLREQLKF